MAQIVVENYGLRFRTGLHALKGVDLIVERGEFVAIVGPSGCGKSSLLNAIAGLYGPDEVQSEGRILVDGREIRRSRDWQGRLGYVFRRDTLMPWRTVLQNVEMGLEIRQVPPAQRHQRARELIALVGLEGFEHHYPHQISGGMRQRVSLIRTLAYDPEVILLDEPFGALDAHTRMVLQGELIRLWMRTGKTMLFVTHDLAEAVTLAQRVVVFSRRPGRVIQSFEVPFPYPRDPFELKGQPTFAEFQAMVWQWLVGEFRGDREVRGLELSV